MNGVVLYGLGGSGKTQLVLNFIEKHKTRYTSILWINASSKEAISQSFADIKGTLTEVWPSRDLPNPVSRDASAERVILSRLRSTIYNNWLLIIDSADDVERTNFASLVPLRCPHGSVIVTSIRRSAPEQFEALGFSSLEIDSLDDQSAGQLLLFTSVNRQEPGSGPNDTANHHANEIVRELHGIPLAIEQAGVLIRKTIVTYENFVDKYLSHYKILMAKKPAPGVTSYDKEHSVIAIISLLFSAIQNESPDSARLLQVLCVLGRQSIPFDLLKSLSRTESGAASTNSLEALFADDTLLLICISTLSDACLVKFNYNQSRSQKIISVHGLICQWVFDMALPDYPHDLLWIVEGLMDFIQPPDDSPLSPYRPDHQLIKSPFVPLLDNTLSVVKRILKADLTTQYVEGQVARKLAYLYLAAARLQEATGIFQGFIELERTSEGDSWPSTEASLKLLVGLAVCRQHAKDHQAAIDALQTSLKLAEKLFDDFDDRTAEISTRLKLISERYEMDLQQHKAVVIASTGSNLTKKGIQPVSEARPSPNPEGQSFDVEIDDNISWEDLCDTLDWPTYDAVNALNNRRTILMEALLRPTDVAAKAILREKSGEIDVEVADYEGQTAIFYAACRGHCKIIQLLISKYGANPNVRNIQGQTALCNLVTSRRETVDMLGVVKELLEGGADPQIPDLNGFTPFLGAVSILKDAGVAYVLFESGKININHQDIQGNTALHLLLKYPEPGESLLLSGIEDLLEWGADLDLRNILDQTAFDISTESWDTPDTMRLLLTPKSNMATTDYQKKTPLIVGACLGELATVRAVLEYDGVDVNAQDEDGMSALFHAIQRGDDDVVDLLLHRPELNRGVYGHGIGREFNSIQFAVLEEEMACLRLLIRKSLPETQEAIRLAGNLEVELLLKDIGTEIHGKEAFEHVF